jgi:hypothetical protein
MPPFSITISGDSLNALAENFGAAAKLFGQDATGAPAAAPAAAPKVARTRAKPAEDAPAPVAAPAAAPAAAEGVTKEAVVKKLVTLINANEALGRNGKQVCTDLCTKFGGKNASAIDPSKYGQVVEAVDTALEALNEDPTA